jgi:hypothetical protein
MAVDLRDRLYNMVDTILALVGTALTCFLASKG